MAAKNGIPMHEIYEKAFDDARLIIIPDAAQKRFIRQWLLFL
jgi:hypothetical protein